MGKSTVISSSSAVDNRLAVTDQAFGLSSSGTGNNIEVSLLDGGAIKSAFDFAKGSLSEMLGSVISGQKEQYAASQVMAEKVSGAMSDAAKASAKASEGVTGTIIESGKNLLMVAAAAFVAWKIWGHK